ncbi:hypothetical protein ACTA71_002295 [Dictyostelium dimigraforme]
MKLFILLVLILSILFNEINGDEYVNFIPYSNDECTGEEIGIGYSSVLSKCLPSIDSHQNYLFKLKSKDIIEWTVFKYSNHNNNNNNNCNSNKSIILQPSFTSKIGSCISSKYINLDSKISMSSQPIHYKISITKNLPYISSKSIVNSFTLDKKCSSNSVSLIQYFTNHLNVNYKSNNNNNNNNNNNKISYHCVNDNPFTRNQFKLIEPIIQECTQFKNGGEIISLNVRFSSGSGDSGGESTSGGGGESTSGGEISSTSTGNSGDSSTGNSGDSTISSISSTGENTGFSTSSTGDDTTSNTGFSSTTDVTTATSATTGGVTSGDDANGTGAINFKPNSSILKITNKLYKKTYCTK